MAHVSITWDKNSERNLTSSMNFRGRAMELSDLSVFHNRILTPDDKTGVISEIKDSKMIPWVFLNSGPGNTTSPFKCEWMTIKDDVLYVGGHGTVTNVDWTTTYDKLRNAVGIFEPGYLTHEAVQWSEIQAHWFFLPRKESKTVYVDEEDETKCTDLLIMGSPDLDYFEAKRIGVLRHERGYSTFDFIPGTDDKIIVALKSKEVTDEPVETYITVFTIDGKVLLDDQKLGGNYKFEGLYFV
ncbi:Apyrase [Teladorsagia circumcincta]|uniref:Apyrase n=1 Tax=Teladorsagia circumcincta TaxID=45464 RepID=A0A2G9UYB7_TELCI|nr:Apyrase [Teladorsagia circumcincta]